MEACTSGGGAAYAKTAWRTSGARRRAGTESLAHTAGFARAVELVVQGLPGHHEQALELRRTLLEELDKQVGAGRYVINGNEQHTVPGILNISFPGAGTDVLLMNLDMEQIAAASGSACTSGSLEISHVLRAMKLPEELLNSAIRFSTGLGNTNEEMQVVARKVGTVLSGCVQETRRPYILAAVQEALRLMGTRMQYLRVRGFGIP